jgi:hypothetical protein
MGGWSKKASRETAGAVRLGEPTSLQRTNKVVLGAYSLGSKSGVDECCGVNVEGARIKVRLRRKRN